MVPGGRAYCSIQEIRDYLQTIDVDVISSDEEIIDLIYKAANGIDRSCRRRFDLVTVVERHDGAGQQKMVLDNYPLVQVQRLQVYNMNNQLITDIKSTDANFSTELIIDYVNGFIMLPPAAYPLGPIPYSTPWFYPYTSYMGYPLVASPFDYSTRFGMGTSNIVVTYIYGYQTPPEKIREAAMKLVIIELLKKKGLSDTQGVATASIAGMSETYAVRGASGAAGPFGHTIAELQADVKETCTLFRKKKWLVV